MYILVLIIRCDIKDGSKKESVIIDLDILH
jgi:hypothetical protein